MEGMPSVPAGSQKWAARRFGCTPHLRPLLDPLNGTRVVRVVPGQVKPQFPDTGIGRCSNSEFFARLPGISKRPGFRTDLEKAVHIDRFIRDCSDHLYNLIKLDVPIHYTLHLKKHNHLPCWTVCLTILRTGRGAFCSHGQSKNADQPSRAKAPSINPS